MIDSSAKNALFSSENRERTRASLLRHKPDSCVVLLPVVHAQLLHVDRRSPTPTSPFLGFRPSPSQVSLSLSRPWRSGRFVSTTTRRPFRLLRESWASLRSLSAAGFALASPVLSLVVFPLVFAVCNAVFWVAWGEFHARRKSNFSLSKFAFTFGSVMLPSAIVASLLPHYVIDVFVASFPVISAFAYIKENQGLGNRELPTLLPKATRAKTFQGNCRHLDRDLRHVRRMLLQHRRSFPKARFCPTACPTCWASSVRPWSAWSSRSFRK